MNLRHGSLFSQLLGIVNRGLFERIVRETNAEKGAKGFGCWDQLVAMLFCQLAQARSLREISGGLQCCEGKLRHLGIEQAPGKSTLSYANAKRPWQLFERLFYSLLDAKWRGETGAEVSFQEQAAEPGFNGHRTVRDHV